MMRIKLIAVGLAALAVFGAAGLFGQSSIGQSSTGQSSTGQSSTGQSSIGQTSTASPPGLEFPVIMRQKVEAGATPVGTKVEARLTLATLVDHAVIPQDAVLSGEVTESVAKSAKGPSRLGIRMDLAQWKSGSAPIKVYLTAWFYPIAQVTPQDFPEEGQPLNSRPFSAPTITGAGPKSQPARSYPSRDPDTNPSAPPPSAAPAPSTSSHRDVMKGVEAKRKSDGAITLSSQHTNIKLDKTTTYVLAAGDAVPK
jgi:hypothetical protein